jgi:hypothetical protein
MPRLAPDVGAWFCHVAVCVAPHISTDLTVTPLRRLALLLYAAELAVS